MKTYRPLTVLGSTVLAIAACSSDAVPDPASAVDAGGATTAPDGGGAQDGGAAAHDAARDAGAIGDAGSKDGATGPGEGGAPISPPTCVDTTALPAWRQGMAVGAWKEITSADLAAVTPAEQPGGYYAARIDAWNGFATDTTTSTMYIGGAGGHADYAGNEVYAIDLNAAAPAWVLECQPSPASAYTIDQPYYTDGRPSPTHTYYTLWFIEERHELFRFGGAATWGSGNGGTDRIDSWNPATKAWDPEGTNARLPYTTYETPTAKHPYTGDVYQLGSDNHVRRWSQATNTVTDLGNAGAGRDTFYDMYKSPSVVDPVSNRLLFLADGASGPTEIRVYDLATAAWSTATLTGAAASGVAAKETQGMAHYDTCAKKVFLKTPSGGEVLALDPTTMETGTLATSGDAPPDPVNGVHTRFQSVPKLGGYAYQPSSATKLYFLATQ